VGEAVFTGPLSGCSIFTKFGNVLVKCCRPDIPEEMAELVIARPMVLYGTLVDHRIPMLEKPHYAEIIYDLCRIIKDVDGEHYLLSSIPAEKSYSEIQGYVEELSRQIAEGLKKEG